MRALTRTRPRLVALVTALAMTAAVLVLAPRVAAEPQVLNVGEGHEFSTLQDAVNAANAGDRILVHPGVYGGDVFVGEDKQGLVIRGTDRNAVIFDGGFSQGNAITVRADDVKLENMTARNFAGNGFYWRSVSGFEGRYLTTYRIGLYGIYAFDSTDGIFEKSYASGSADAAFYIGQCRPCNALIDDVVGEWSALGYSGTNAGGNLIIRNSVWRLNGAGIVPNSLDSQRDPPQRGGTWIVDNEIYENGNPDTPSYGIAGAIMGHGIGIAGGADNVVQRNVIRDNTHYGVVLFPIPGGDMVYLPNDNSVRDNVFADNGEADMALSAGNGTGNCFSGNEHTTTLPSGLEENYPCDDDSALMKRVPVAGDPGVAATLAEEFFYAQAGMQDRPSYKDTPEPEPQPSMPNAEQFDD